MNGPFSSTEKKLRLLSLLKSSIKKKTANLASKRYHIFQ